MNLIIKASILMLVIVSVSYATTIEPQAGYATPTPIIVVIPGKFAAGVAISAYNSLPTCYSLASNGGFGAPLNWAKLSQTDMSGLNANYRSWCTDTFYSSTQINQMLDEREVSFQKKIDDTKKAYVDKINSLPQDVLDAIKQEVKEQVVAEVLPQLREQIKKELEAERASKASAKPPKATDGSH